MRTFFFPLTTGLIVLSSCQGVAFLGNLAVLGVTLGIFMGTLSLGRDR